MTAEEYFSRDEFKRLLELCRDKYISLSHIGGSVTLKAPSDGERGAVGGLLGKVYEEGDIKIALKTVDGALHKSRFGIGLEELLQICFKDSLKTRRAMRAAEKSKRDRFFDELLRSYPDGMAAEWLQYMMTKKSNVFTKRYNENKELLRHDIGIVCRVFENIGRPRLLPVFAAKISGDPHMLDEGSSCGQLFDYALMYLTGMEHTTGASGRSAMLERVGIYSDMVSSFVYCRNIRLCDGSGEHPAYRAFSERNEAFTLNIGNLTEIERAYAWNDTVYIVENPAVFTSLARATEHISLICTAGQPKGACLSLLRLLGNIRMYYSGDFDMGGINIAERFFSMFGNMRPWRFSAEDYICALSDKRLPEPSLAGLRGMCGGNLAETVQLMLQTGFAGYQENILDMLIADVQAFREEDQLKQKGENNGFNLPQNDKKYSGAV